MPPPELAAGCSGAADSSRGACRATEARDAAGSSDRALPPSLLRRSSRRLLAPPAVSSRSRRKNRPRKRRKPPARLPKPRLPTTFSASPPSQPRRKHRKKRPRKPRRNRPNRLLRTISSANPRSRLPRKPRKKLRAPKTAPPDSADPFAEPAKPAPAPRRRPAPAESPKPSTPDKVDPNDPFGGKNADSSVKPAPDVKAPEAKAPEVKAVAEQAPAPKTAPMAVPVKDDLKADSADPFAKAERQAGCEADPPDKPAKPPTMRPIRSARRRRLLRSRRNAKPKADAVSRQPDAAKPADAPVDDPFAPAPPSRPRKTADRSMHRRHQSRRCQSCKSTPAPTIEKTAAAAAATKPAIAAVVENDPMRVWHDDSGEYEVRAKLVLMLDGKVRLLKDTGKYTTVPLDRLSPADLTYVHSMRRRCWRSSPRNRTANSLRRGSIKLGPKPRDGRARLCNCERSAGLPWVPERQAGRSPATTRAPRKRAAMPALKVSCFSPTDCAAPAPPERPATPHLLPPRAAAWRLAFAAFPARRSAGSR